MLVSEKKKKKPLLRADFWKFLSYRQEDGEEEVDTSLRHC